jgi:general secretion pathway protein J
MSSRQRPHPSAKSVDSRRMAGFTLLEIMVAMLLLTIIITSSVSLLFLNVRGWDALMADSERMLDEVLINDRISNTLRSVTPLKFSENGQQQLAFVGEAQRLQFISTAPQQYLAGGLFEYLLMVERDTENSAALVLYYAPYKPDATAFSLPMEGEKRTLISDLSSLSFSFYGKKRRSREADWSETWEPEEENYPDYIKISLTKEGEASAPEMRFIRLLANHPAVLR